jgi:hypothetical protein
MSRGAVGIAYTQSLFCIALLTAFIVCLSLNFHLVFFDLIHGNPNRTLGNVLIMMTAEAALIGFIAVIGALLVFSVPQIFQAALVNLCNQIWGNDGRFAALVALPFTAILTWYCYDYLTPSNINLGINAGPEWTPYQHGISTSRYLGALSFQAPATLFSFAFLEARFRGRSVKPVLFTVLAIAVTFSIAWGYAMTRDQIELQNRKQTYRIEAAVG